MCCKLRGWYDDFVVYLDECIFKKIGIVFINWNKSVDGNLCLFMGVDLLVREWVWFGEFVCCGGNW